MIYLYLYLLVSVLLSRGVNLFLTQPLGTNYYNKSEIIFAVLLFLMLLLGLLPTVNSLLL